MDKKQFEELLASAKEMDEIVMRTDWKRLAKMKDKDIDTSEAGELDAEFFRNARLRMPDK